MERAGLYFSTLVYDPSPNHFPQRPVAPMNTCFAVLNDASASRILSRTGVHSEVEKSTTSFGAARICRFQLIVIYYDPSRVGPWQSGGVSGEPHHASPTL